MMDSSSKNNFSNHSRRSNSPSSRLTAAANRSNVHLWLVFFGFIAFFGQAFLLYLSNGLGRLGVLDSHDDDEFTCTVNSETAKVPDVGNVILVTGGAGFVGMHTTLLLMEKGYKVVVIDNMSEYYSTQLKRDRVEVLKQSAKDDGQLVFVEGDVCDAELFAKIIQDNHVDRIVHLAAQAGVRYSLENPRSYVKNNVDCFVVVLESLVKAGLHNKPIVYASSSSVYGFVHGGLDAKPFSEDKSIVDEPGSLYAATKRADELMAYTYSRLYNVSSVGLRFFTVYGPWGRPDMSPMIFADKIVKDKPIEMTNYGRSVRDFTYVSDIANGVVAALEYQPEATVQPDMDLPKASAEIFNLGGKNPIDLAYFVSLFEKGLEKNATKNLVPIRKGDVPTTYADVRKAKCHFGWEPKVSIEKGMELFLEWFRDHNGSQYMGTKSFPKAVTEPKKRRTKKSPIALPTNLNEAKQSTPSSPKSALRRTEIQSPVAPVQKSAAGGIDASVSTTTPAKKPLCILTASFGENVKSLDKAMNVKKKAAFKDDDRFAFFFFTNQNTTEFSELGWETIVMDLPYKRIITQSRWPKFMGWQHPRVQESCEMVFYVDSNVRPKGWVKPEHLLSFAATVRNSEVGFAFTKHTIKKRKISDEWKAIEQFKKDTPDHIQAAQEWMRQQPDYKDNAQVWELPFFCYNPLSEKFHELTEFFWNKYSLELDSWRDQPLMAYSVHHVGVTPYPLTTMFFKKDGKANGFNDHTYVSSQ